MTNSVADRLRTLALESVDERGNPLAVITSPGLIIDAVNEIERLARERDVWKSKAVHRGESASRLRAALRIAAEELAMYVDFQRKHDYLEYAERSQQKLDAINTVLSGEPRLADEPSEIRSTCMQCGRYNGEHEQGCSAEKSEAEPCEHLRSEMLAEKDTAATHFEMRKCLDCNTIFRKRLSVRTDGE